MELLVARTELKEKPKTITYDKIKEQLELDAHQMMYFDRDNSHKDMMALVDSLENEDLNVYFREVKYGLADEEYLYEVHTI